MATLTLTLRCPMWIWTQLWPTPSLKRLSATLRMLTSTPLSLKHASTRPITEAFVNNSVANAIVNEIISDTIVFRFWIDETEGKHNYHRGLINHSIVVIPLNPLLYTQRARARERETRAREQERESKSERARARERESNSETDR